MSKGRFEVTDWSGYAAKKAAAPEVTASPSRPEAKAYAAIAPALTPTG